MPIINGRDQERLRYRLIVLGVPFCYINPLMDLIKHWETHNGIEWTISRLKSLKVDLFRRKAGLSNLTWIRKNRHNDIAGPIGGLFRWADKSEKNFKICIQVFMMYTTWVSSIITDKQLKKFISGVTAPPSSINGSLIENISIEAKRFASKDVLPLPDSILAYEGSSVKRSPMLFGQPSTYQNCNILQDLQIFNTDGGLHLYSKYPRLFSSVIKGLDNRKTYLDSLTYHEGFNPDIRVGNVAFIQEPGFKLRSVASPFRLFQMVLKPFGDKLYQIARRMPWDCTHDQSAALEPIRCALEKGTKVYSVDLSSATDFFPLEIQLACVRSILIDTDHDYINLWADLCRGQWKLPSQEIIQWTCGQPLGMYPSFAAFTISHGLLLKSLLKKKWKGEFYVVGDDVIIIDDQLASDYMRTLDELGCPYSTDKTLASEKIAEFAGKIITSKGVYPQMKWRELSDDNFLDLCKSLGQRSRLLLRSRQRKIFDLVKNLCDPIGLNFSLPGDNLEKMVKRTIESPFWKSETAVLSSLLGLRRRINNTIYSYNNSYETINETEVKDIISTFDEKVKFVLKQTVFSNFENISIIIDGLASLPEALGLIPRLPLLVKPPSRVSTLERYETILKSLS